MEVLGTEAADVTRPSKRHWSDVWNVEKLHLSNRHFSQFVKSLSLPSARINDSGGSYPRLFPAQIFNEHLKEFIHSRTVRKDGAVAELKGNTILTDEMVGGKYDTKDILQVKNCPND